MRYDINDKVLTKDGWGLVKKIEEGYSGVILYTVTLQVPYIITDPYQGTRQTYPDTPYLFGYTYTEDELSQPLTDDELERYRIDLDKHFHNK